MHERTPWSPEAFEERYAAAPDPWSFASSPYELDRYDRILAALRPAPHRYRLAYEPGCSVGVLTEQLVRRCDRLIATDVSATAIARARARCGAATGLHLEVGRVQDGPGTDELLDLLVFSEVGYYLAADELADVLGRLRAGLAPGADVVACHWTGRSDDHRLHGSTVHEILGRAFEGEAEPVIDEVHDGFVLGAWRIG